MKIVRFLTTASRPMYGVWEEEAGVRIIAGDVFGVWAISDTRLRLEEITRILPPVEPPNIFALGLNYRAHASEGGSAAPDHPLVFLKATSSITGRDRPIILPKSAPTMVDYEAELALIIGKTAYEVSEEKALDHVLGYTAANDVSARDCQMQLDKQWARGKSFDTFCPIGPFIETEHDPDHAQVKSRLNGQVMQDSCTTDLIFSCRYLVSYLSHQFTLHPGTLILTGTPSGVGVHRNPPVFLKDGDVIEVELEGVGTLSNPVFNAA
jgi:2-keto-4-pentenoate hydratase/2-oxohepta-3-ene-1,7-dioic acid hydratase in catechol pathway